MVTTNLSRLLMGVYVIFVVSSCKQKPVNTNYTNRASQLEIDSLITQGNAFLYSNTDSLFITSKKLTDAAHLSGNKVALVYGELFTAQYYWLLGNHQKSMEIAVDCLSDAEKWKTTKLYPIIYGLISNLYKEKFNYQFAFNAQQQGLRWAIANKDTASIISMIGLKAMLIHTLKHAVHNSKGRDTSINLHLAALKIAESDLKFESYRISLYDNIAQYYLEDDWNYKKTIYYGLKGVQLALKYNRKRSLTYSYTWLGKALYFNGEKKKGIGYLNKALMIARSIKEPFREMEIYDSMYDCYYYSGDYEKAIALSQIARTMDDSLQVHLNEKQISELQIKYETAKKDKEIFLMDHEAKVKNRQIMIFLGGGLLGLIFCVILILQYLLIRRNNQLIKLSSEKKDIALKNIAFIQAHELRKPLASIMGLINVIKAMDYKFEEECILHLEKAGRELDEKIHSILTHAETDSQP
jgi:tetratricopeptide (TPR) repeat protein